MRISGIPTIYLLAFLISIGPLSTDMYLASLPDMAREFNIAAGTMQLTLGVYLVGWALSMLVVGPLSDAYGRKPVIIVGLCIYILSSLLCAFSYNIELLLFSRLLQSIGAAATTVVARATVRDIYQGVEAAKMLSLMGSLMALVPALSPILGGYLHTYFFWEANFFAMALAGLFCFALTHYGFKETLDNSDRQNVNIQTITSAYIFLLKDRKFIGFTGAVTFSVAGSFTFISSSSFVLQNVYQTPPEQFGFYFGIVVLGFICGTLIGAGFTKKYGIENMVFWATVTAVAASLGSIVLSLFGLNAIIALIAPQTVLYMCVGVIGPQATAGALTPHPEIAGRASSLISFFPVAIGALAGYIATSAFNGTQYPMSITIFLMTMLALLSFIGLVRFDQSHRYQQHSDENG